jgi:hypothetical protein
MGAAVPNRPRVLVLVEPDPDVLPPPLHLIPGDVEAVQIGSNPTDDDLAGASALYIWDHRFSGLDPLLRTQHHAVVRKGLTGTKFLIRPANATWLPVRQNRNRFRLGGFRS